MEEAVEKDPNVKNREIRIFRLSRETECTPCNTHKRSYRRYIWLNSKGSNGQKTKKKKKNMGLNGRVQEVMQTVLVCSRKWKSESSAAERNSITKHR